MSYIGRFYKKIANKYDMEISTLCETYLKNNHKVLVNIANFYGFDDKQIEDLRASGCEWSCENGWFFITETIKHYRAMCKRLANFNQGYLSTIS